MKFLCFFVPDHTQILCPDHTIRYENLSVIMKNISTIISALLFIAGSVVLDMHLSEGKKHVPMVLKQQVYASASAHLCIEKAESWPVESCNCERQVEGAHLENSRVAIARKVFPRNIAFVPLAFLSRHSATVPPISSKAQSDCITYTVSNIPLHVRNCVWLI